MRRDRVLQRKKLGIATSACHGRPTLFVGVGGKCRGCVKKCFVGEGN